MAILTRCGLRAYQDANGWYVAREGADGFHRAPAASRILPPTEAAAIEKHERDCPDCSGDVPDEDDDREVR